MRKLLLISLIFTLFFSCKKEEQTSLHVGSFMKSGTKIVLNPSDFYIFSGNMSDKIAGAASLAAVTSQAKYFSFNAKEFKKPIESGIYTIVIQNKDNTTYGKKKISMKVITVEEKQTIITGHLFEEYGADGIQEIWNEYIQ